MKVEFYLGIGYANAEHVEEVELPDDYTEQDIQEEFDDWVNNWIDSGWQIIEEESEVE